MSEMDDLYVEVNELRATIEHVKALHVMHHVRNQKWCQEDQQSWPCPTIRALEEPSADQCVTCGHQHAGENLAGVCIGCSCEARSS